MTLTLIAVLMSLVACGGTEAGDQAAGADAGADADASTAVLGDLFCAGYASALCAAEVQCSTDTDAVTADRLCGVGVFAPYAPPRPENTDTLPGTWLSEYSTCCAGIVACDWDGESFGVADTVDAPWAETCVDAARSRSCGADVVLECS